MKFLLFRYKRSSLPVQRALSLPKLSPSSDGDSSSDPYIPTAYAPPKPPRTALILSNGSSNMSDAKDRCDKAEIRNALQNWQMNLLMNEWEAKDKLDKRRAMAIPNTSYINRGSADGSSNNCTLASQQSFQQQSVSSQQQTQQQQHLTSTTSNQKSLQSIYPTNRSPTLLEFQKKSNRRREIRRHTLQNGIDYNMLKRIRHYEEEKDLLLDGLHAVEKTQEWYFKQITLIQDKMKCLGQGDGHLVSQQHNSLCIFEEKKTFIFYLALLQHSHINIFIALGFQFFMIAHWVCSTVLLAETKIPFIHK